MAFGDVEVGTTSTQTLSFSNSGSSSLTVSQTGVSGSGFTVSGVTSPLTLPAGQSGSLSVQFAPTVTGIVSGSVSVVSNASNSPTTIALSGNGVRHQLSLTPTSISFGNVAVGTAATQTITLTNSGTANLNISQGNVTGAGFSVSGLNFPVALAPGQSGALSVQFAPTATGSVSGSVTLVSNTRNSPDVLPLTGNGIQPATGQLTPNPSNISFGNVTVASTSAQTVTMTNTGSSGLSISQVNVTGAGFSASGLSVPMSLAAGQNASLSVAFAPTAAGSVTGTVSVVSNATNSPLTVALSGMGTQGALAANPASVGFGSVLVGSSGSQTISLTNGGTASITVSQATSSGTGFSLSGLTLPLTLTAGQNATFTAQFSPSATGSASGSISITSNAPSSPLIVALSGTGVQPQLSATPTSVSFGNVVAGISNSLTINLTNGGSASVTISQAAASGAGFSITGLTVPATIAAGQSTTFNVVFTPSSAGSVTGSVSLVSNAPNSPLTISLSGTGVTATFLLGANPTSLGFGNVNVGGNNSLGATLTNNGNSNVTISTVTVSGTGFSASGISAGTTLTPNQTVTLNLTFAPAAAGSVTGSVSVASNATNSPAAISLSGTGVQPQISVVPTIIGFGNIVVGSTNTQTITVTNSGTANLTVSQAPVAGSGFSISGLTLPLTLTPGQTTNFNVAFAPAGVGSVTGSVSLVSNAPSSPTAIPLSGTGVAATLQLSASPTSLSFGNVTVGISSTQTVTLTNSGNSSVTISQVNVSGAGFSASGLTLPLTLAAGQNTTLSVLFAPTVVGSVAGSLSVVSNATNSPATITLSGSGTTSSSGLPSCGKVNDNNIYLPPNYDTFVPPAKGQSYIDPVFGCKITRITDAAAMGLVSTNHFYNTINPFNADDSYLFLFSGYTGGSPMIVDLSGNTIIPSSNMPGSNSAIEVWDTTNPKVFYYTSGNQFIKGTITGTPPNATVTPTVLATFSSYSSVVVPADMDISNDGLHIWLADCFQDCTGDVFLVTLNAGNGAATSAAMGAVLPSINHHKLQIVPNNGVSVEGSGPRTIYNTSGAVYEVPGGGTGNHTDWGLDSSGKMVAAGLFFDGTAQNGCPSNWGYGLLDLASNAVRSCLNDGIQNIGNASHVSARDIQSQHWIVFSTDNGGACPSSSFYCFNNPTNMTGWSLYSGEILIWDTSNNTVRLAHHRSRTNQNYWANTRASVSRSGKYIVFDSNYNQSSTSGGVNYEDVYVIGPLY